VINLDIDIIRGNDCTSQLTALTTSSGIVNLSGYFLTGNARFRYEESGNLLNFSPYSSNTASGLVNLNIPSATTAECPVGAYYYNIDAYNSTQRVTLFNGFMNVYPNTCFIDNGSTATVVITQLTYGHGAPTSPPGIPTIAAVYYDLDSYQTYLWNPETQSW